MSNLLIELRTSQLPYEEDWEQLYAKLQEYFKDIPEVSFLKPDVLSKNWNKEFLERYIEAQLGIPRELIGKGLIVLSKDIEKEYHDKVHSKITLLSLAKKESLVDRMTRMEIYSKYDLLSSFIHDSGYDERLLKLKNSGIFPFRTQL